MDCLEIKIVEVVVGDINISGLLEVITADRFINNANITADTLIITTDEFFNNHNGSDQLGNIVVTDRFSLYTPSASYTNTGTVSVDTFALSIAGDFDYASDFLGNGNIDANNQYFTIRNGNFSNTASIVLAGNLGVTADKFNHMFSSLINVYNFNVTTAKDLIINSPAIERANVSAETVPISWGGGVMNIDKTFCGDANNIAYHFTIILKAFSYCNIEVIKALIGAKLSNLFPTVTLKLSALIVPESWRKLPPTVALKLFAVTGELMIKSFAVVTLKL